VQVSAIRKFNALFDKYPLQEAVKKAREMERERAVWSQSALLQEIYQPTWRGWREMPGGDMVQELLDYYKEERQTYQGEPWYPRPNRWGYLWDGDERFEDFRTIEFRAAVRNQPGGASTAFSAAKAFIEHQWELSELAVWWQFDEQTHIEMQWEFCVEHLGAKREEILRLTSKFADNLVKMADPIKVTKKNIRSLSATQALRDGPSVLVGCNMLMEIESPWIYQKTVKAIRKHFDFPSESLAFFNVHSYIDYYHMRLGQYILARYADTKELQELCKQFFIDQRVAQCTRTKELYEMAKRGTLNMSLSKADDSFGV
jgi:Iron-containing redox enzyme